jgi:hypothetical protein
MQSSSGAIESRLKSVPSYRLLLVGLNQLQWADRTGEIGWVTYKTSFYPESPTGKQFSAAEDGNKKNGKTLISLLRFFLFGFVSNFQTAAV